MTGTPPKPPRARSEAILERIGPHLIQDPYRWMEDSGPELKRWVDGQHRYALEKLSAWPARERLRARFAELLDLGSVGTPVRRGNRYFHTRRRADQQLPVLCVREGLDGAERVLLDPNELAQDRTITLAEAYFSADGRLAVCQLSKRATSRALLRVLDVDSGRFLDDTIPADLYPLAQTRPGVNAACWTPDSGGFYYTRRPDSAPAAEHRYHQKLYFHRLGEHWSDDELVFGRTLRKEQSPYPRLSRDGRHLLVQVLDLSGNAPAVDVYLYDRGNAGQGFLPVITGFNALFDCQMHRNALYLKTNLNAPNGKIVKLQLANPGREPPPFQTILPESDAVIRAWAVVADRLCVEIIRDASSRLQLYDLAGGFVKEIDLPGIGSLKELRAEPDGRELFFSFSSFLVPDTVYRVDLNSSESALWMGPELPFDATRFKLKQVWYQSLDGTRIPMFLVHAKGIGLDGDNPAVVHGYGGFNESKLPEFNPGIIPFLESGGIYALANIRGGGEFGEAWHRSGMRASKQNVFDDFIAAAQWLIDSGYTNPARIGCYGWSNGGLLVNAVAQQRPELWRAVVAGAPVADMARFHMGPGGRNWIADYGSPEDPRDLGYLLRYCPYHNLPEEIAAPALLIWVPEEDDRVAPWHGYKMLARWQAANVSDRPVLLRAEAQAGHRGGIAADRAIARHTDIWTFFFSQLDLRLRRRRTALRIQD